MKNDTPVVFAWAVWIAATILVILSVVFIVVMMLAGISILWDYI